MKGVMLCRVSGTGTAALPVPLTRHNNFALFFPGVRASPHPWLSSDAAIAANCKPLAR